ncbi:hypothetical protein BGZ76_009884 [Entomortierella beljakovae]|nr:hypothetical protein BGZ76_009884 [Entomortierella beljakovae]
MGFIYRRLTFKAAALMAVIALYTLIETASSITIQKQPNNPNPLYLSKRWHAEPPPVLQKPCLVVDKHNGRTYMIGYDSQNTLVFNFIDSTQACDKNKKEKLRSEKVEGEEWRDSTSEFDWRNVQWTSLPYPGGSAHHGRRFDTESCFLSSDLKFMVPSYEPDGEGGFSVWDHDLRTWTHIRNDKECSCNEEEVEHEGKVKVKKDKKKLKFEYPNLFTVVYQSYRAKGARHGGTRLAGIEEAIDTVVIQWKDRHDRDHITGIQLLNHKVYSCHDIKIGHNILPPKLTLAASPNNPYHYTFHNTPGKYRSEGDHGSRCENTTLFLFGPNGSGWFNISIADRPSTRPVDIMYTHQENGIKGGFHTLPNLEVDHPRAVYYGGQLWIFGKNHQGVGVWSIDTSSSNTHYEITAQSQGGPSPGGLTCASCGDGIIVYGGCDRAEDCSTNLRPGEQGQISGNAPVSVYRPGTKNDDEDDDDNDNDHEGSGSGGSGSGGSGSGGSSSGGSGSSGSGSGGSSSSGSGSGSGGSGSGGSGSSGSGSGGSGSGSGGSGYGSGGSGGSDSGESGSGGSSSGGSGSGGSGSGGSGSGGSGSGGSGSGGSGSGGSGSGGSGSGSSGSGSSGSGSGGSGSGGSGSSSGGSGSGGGSWSPDSGVPSGTVPEGVPGAVIPNPFPNPETSGQVLVGTTSQTAPTAAPTVTLTITSAPIPLPTNTTPGGAKSSEEGNKNTAMIIGLTLGLLAFIALLSLLFIAARKRRHNDAEVAVGGGDSMGGAGPLGPGGYIDSPNEPKYPGGAAMPPLAPLGPASGIGGPSVEGGGLSGDGNVGVGGPASDLPSSGPSGAGSAPSVGSGPAMAVGGAVLAAGVIAGAHKHKDSTSEKQETYSAGHVTNDETTTETSGVTGAKRSSRAKFFMGGGDYKPHLRRPSPTPAAPAFPVINQGPKTEVDENSLPQVVGIVPKEELVSNQNNNAILAGAAGAAIAVGAAAAARHSKESHVEESSETSAKISKTTTTTNVINGGTSTTTTNIINGGNSTSTVVAGSSGETKVNSGSETIGGSSNSTTVVSHTTGGVTSGMVAGGAMVVGGVIMGAGQQSKEKVVVQNQQMPPTLNKTQITLKLSILRYERKDAAEATPLAKPGTLMFSQLEMLESAPYIKIPGSTFSHVRDSSKVKGNENGLPSPLVPGPSGAASSTESEPRERSLRWMTNEQQWKREAGMLQHLRSERYIAELFTLYSLPTYAEYRFVSVMGPFTRTLESYINERKGVHRTDRAPTLEEQSLASKGPLTLTEIKSMTDGIASALKWCHDHHVVHLGLSPASIFLQEIYSEPDGQGGYRTSVYSPYFDRAPNASKLRDSAEPRIEQRWKLWNFSHSRFIGEPIDPNMDKNRYTSPEIIISSRQSKQVSAQVIKAGENPQQETRTETSVTREGAVTKTTTTKTTSGTTVISNEESTEKLVAATTMDMWSLGQIVYEMHTSQTMFVSEEDAFLKLSSALEDSGDDKDLDKANAHEKIRAQLQSQIEKIDKIQDHGAREVIKGLLEMRQERRLEHEEIRSLYLDVQN